MIEIAKKPNKELETKSANEIVNYFLNICNRMAGLTTSLGAINRKLQNKGMWIDQLSVLFILCSNNRKK